jgi:NADH-quinone oxidoreductase subunit N
MLSLLGFPGTFGFIGKWFLITAPLAEGNLLLPIVAMIGSGISIGYYLPVILAMTLKPVRTRSAHQTIRFPLPAKIVVAICVIGILVLGVWPNEVLNFASQEAVQLRQLATPILIR